MTPTAHVVVVTGGGPISDRATTEVTTDAIIIAADGGLDHARAAGLEPSILVGDLDSISEAGLAWARDHDVTIDRHDTEKDATDTELALAAAADLNPDRLTVLAGAGDRLDHTLGVIGALGSIVVTSIPRIDLWWTDQQLRILHGPGHTRLTDVAVGTTVSLLAVRGPCSGVSITGVRWELDDDELEALSGRGVSNVATASDVEVRVRSGILAVCLVDEYRS